MTKVATIAIHATALVVGESGIVICGPSGSGKSRLALLILAEAAQRGRFARLVGDDRVLVRAAGPSVLAAPHLSIVGLIERRTQPFAVLPWEGACVVRLVVELVPPETPLPRYPQTHADVAHIGGLGPLPRLRLQGPVDALSCHAVLEALGTAYGIVKEP